MVPLLSEVEASAVCGVSIQTLRRWSVVPGFPRPNPDGKYLQAQLRSWCIGRGDDPICVVRRRKSRADKLKLLAKRRGL